MSRRSDEHLKEEPSGGMAPGLPPRTAPGPEPADGTTRPSVCLQLPQAPRTWRTGQVHCPFCLRLLESTVIGLSTGLGPSVLQCGKCGRQLVSHHREWHDRGVAGKAWYVALSLLYVVGCAALALLCAWCGCAFARRPAGWLPASVAGSWGLTVAGLQVLRVAQSIQRTRRVPRRPYRCRFWGSDLFLPQKILAGILLSTALVWLAGVAANR